MRRIVVGAIVGALACGGCQAAGVPIAADPEGPPIDGKAVCVPASGGSWTNEVIDATGTVASEIGPLGSTPSLAVRPDGVAAVAYGNVSARGFLELALRGAASGWTKPDLGMFGQESDDGLDPVVRFDHASRPVIAVARRIDAPESIDVRLGDGTVTSIDLMRQSAYDLAMALDADDQPRVAYGRSDALYYAAWSGGAWHVEHVQDGTIIGVSLALDADGRPNVLFQAHDQNWVQLARRDDDGAWTVETVDVTSVGPLHWTQLALDSHGRPHVTYVDWSDAKSPLLKYAVRGDAGWQIEPVKCAGAVSAATMVLDAANRPHVAFATRDRTGDFNPSLVAAPLGYAVRALGGWEIETLGGGGEADEWPSLVVGGDGVARASWFDIFSGTVRYGERTP